MYNKGLRTHVTIRQRYVALYVTGCSHPQSNCCPSDQILWSLQPEGSNQQCSTGMKTCRHIHRSEINTAGASYFQLLGCWWTSCRNRLTLCSIRRLVRSLNGLWDPRALPLWETTVLWPLGIFSLYNACEVMFSRPRACSRVFCPPQQTVSTWLYSYENIARQREAYPVPSSEQWKKTCHWHCTVGHLWDKMPAKCRQCLSLIWSQLELEVDSCLPHSKLMTRAAEHRWLMTSIESSGGLLPLSL